MLTFRRSLRFMNMLHARQAERPFLDSILPILPMNLAEVRSGEELTNLDYVLFTTYFVGLSERKRPKMGKERGLNRLCN